MRSTNALYSLSEARSSSYIAESSLMIPFLDLEAKSTHFALSARAAGRIARAKLINVGRKRILG